MQRKVIIDCDPGQDDALMLFLAFAAPEELNILGVCAVAGNVPLEKTQRNICILSDIVGNEKTPMFAGCDKPLTNVGLTAEHVHGREGIDGIDIFSPRTKLQPKGAVDFIVETLLSAADDEITLVVTGPFTNIASAILREPAILPKIRELVLMGGAMREGGNITPSAEFNIFVDPHAAKIVFECGRPIAAFGLDVTHQVFTSPSVLERVAMLENRVAKASHGMLAFFGRYDAQKYRAQGAPLHDPCTIAYLLWPELFELKSCNIRVETDSELTMGHTAVDFWGVTGLPANTEWAHSVQRDGFFDLLIERLSRY
jgi:inosine-uridine nucleoside N-ribohydrolase